MQVRVTAPLEVDGGSTEAGSWCLLCVLWRALAGDGFVGVSWRGTACCGSALASEGIGEGRLVGVRWRDGVMEHVEG